MSSSRAGCDQCHIPIFMLESVSSHGGKSHPRGTEWVAQREGTSPQVELIHRQRSELGEELLVLVI